MPDNTFQRKDNCTAKAFTVRVVPYKSTTQCLHGASISTTQFRFGSSTTTRVVVSKCETHRYDVELCTKRTPENKPRTLLVEGRMYAVVAARVIDTNCMVVRLPVSLPPIDEDVQAWLIARPTRPEETSSIELHSEFDTTPRGIAAAVQEVLRWGPGSEPPPTCSEGKEIISDSVFDTPRLPPGVIPASEHFDTQTLMKCTPLHVHAPGRWCRRFLCERGETKMTLAAEELMKRLETIPRPLPLLNDYVIGARRDGLISVSHSAYRTFPATLSVRQEEKPMWWVKTDAPLYTGCVVCVDGARWDVVDRVRHNYGRLSATYEAGEATLTMHEVVELSACPLLQKCGFPPHILLSDAMEPVVFPLIPAPSPVAAVQVMHLDEVVASSKPLKFDGKAFLASVELGIAMPWKNIRITIPPEFGIRDAVVSVMDA